MQAHWTYIVIGICSLLALVFTVQEFRRVNKRFLWLRILAILLAVSSLACLTLPLKYKGAANITNKHRTILLTDGFDADSLTTADTNVVTTSASIKKVYPKARLISDLDELDKANHLHVYGYGLSEEDLSQIDNAQIVFHPAKQPMGVINANWQHILKAGDVLHVQGRFNNTSTQKIKLVLSGLNTGLDSVMLPPNAQTEFDLSATPKTTGKMVFMLRADTAFQGSIPVHVEPVKPLRVLMLSASPDFETKFLKNWLAENGYAVALRSAISKGKFNNEYINIAQLKLDKLSAQTLAKFDVVIGDLSVLNSLSPPESAALKNALSDIGVGLLIKADSAVKTSWLQRQFPVDRHSGKEAPPAQIIINGKKSAGKLSYSNANIIYQNGTQPIVKSTQGQVLVNSAMYGMGRLVFTTLNNTFSWMLNGNKADYANFWSALLNVAARKSARPNTGIEFLLVPYAEQPVQLQVAQGKASPIAINGDTTAAVQDPAIAFLYTLKYWPAAPGWQNMQNNSWFVFGPQDWQAQQAASKLSATKIYASSHKIRAIVTKAIQQKVQFKVPKVYFYILLLAACTFLWAETKFS